MLDPGPKRAVTVIMTVTVRMIMPVRMMMVIVVHMSLRRGAAVFVWGFFHVRFP